MKIIIGLFVLLIIVLVGSLIAQNYFKDNVGPLLSLSTASINGQKFKLYLSQTDKERQIGLSLKKSISADEGMLFKFDKPDYHRFWMKDMRFPIDIIFIRDNKIVTIVSNAKPPKSKEESLSLHTPDEPADTVLEISAGLSAKNNFKKGDTVTIENK